MNAGPVWVDDADRAAFVHDRLLRCAGVLLLLFVLLLLAGCYQVDTVVDAVDAQPGDGVCARSLSAAEVAAGHRAPRRSAADAALQATLAARLGTAGLARLVQGDASALSTVALSAPEAAALAARQAPGGGAGIADDYAPPPAGLCSLRAAIMEANAHAWKSLILVPPGHYRLTLPANAGGGALAVRRNMRIQGGGAGTTIVDAQGDSAVFDISNGDGALPGRVVDDVEINHLTVTGGSAGIGDGSAGLDIRYSQVEMEDVIITGNHGGDGGGASTFGAGSGLSLRRAIVSHNHGTYGGGLRAGPLTMIDSTVHGNTAAVTGGIQGGSMILRNVTISGNEGLDDVEATGGVWIGGGNATLDHVTITNNVGRGDAGPFTHKGGGLQIEGGASVVLRNSIVAGNDGQGGPHDCAGPLAAGSTHNLIGDSARCTIVAQAATFRLDVPAGLGVLGFHGGTTPTHLPAPGSAALDAGSAAAGVCAATDQRGVPRPQGTGCDLGAVEATGTQIAVTGFMLMDAATGADLRPLRHDDWLVLDQLPPHLAIRATVSRGVGSVVLTRGRDERRVDSAAPFSVGPETDGMPVALPLTGGPVQIGATPYTGAKGSGAAGFGRTIRFNVLAP